MTETSLLVGPFNRVEGDLEIKLDIADGVVTNAYVNSPMFRGFERILLGKAPFDALTITPRICGICSISQSAAAARALAAAAGGRPEPEGEKVAALLHAVENIADHITHFNLFFMPDFTRPIYADRAWHAEAVERFTAQKGSSLRAAIEARSKLLHIVGLLGGKWPHTLAIQPGGVTRAPSLRDKIRIAADLREFRKYLETTLFGARVEGFAELSSISALDSWTTGDAGFFLSLAQSLDLATLGRGQGHYMSFGAYPLANGPLFAAGTWDQGTFGDLDVQAITEDISHAWMLGENLHPSQGQTLPDENMREEAYSWCKAPRLSGKPVETGALARQIIDRQPLAIELASEGGVRARIAGRLLEVARTQIILEQLVQSIQPEARFMAQVAMPEFGEGVGLVEAARGSLGHWITIERGQVASYQIIAPTTWNFSPRDSAGVEGPVEAALKGVKVFDKEENPINVQHIVRSFDPCMVCTVH